MAKAVARTTKAGPEAALRLACFGLQEAAALAQLAMCRGCIERHSLRFDATWVMMMHQLWPGQGLPKGMVIYSMLGQIALGCFETTRTAVTPSVNFLFEAHLEAGCPPVKPMGPQSCQKWTALEQACVLLGYQSVKIPSASHGSNGGHHRIPFQFDLKSVRQ